MALKALTPNRRRDFCAKCKCSWANFHLQFKLRGSKLCIAGLIKTLQSTELELFCKPMMTDDSRLHWHLCDRVQAMQCSPPKNSNPIPICNSFIFEAAPENRQHLLAHTCDACDIFEFRFAHYNKLPEHVIDLFLLLLILLFCMMQRVIRKSEKRNKAGEGEEVKLNWLHYTDFIHKAIHCMRHISLYVCVYWCRLCRCNSRHMLSPDLIHIQSDLESDSDSHSYSDSDSDCESDSAWCRIASHRVAFPFWWQTNLRAAQRLKYRLKIDWQMCLHFHCCYYLFTLGSRVVTVRRGEGEVVSAGALFVCQSRATIAQQLV